MASQFIGFHKIEQLIWEDNTLVGAPKLCSGLVANERQPLTLVRSAQYNPLETASGATDLINEAATSKITGEEERYSNTDLPVFQANVATWPGSASASSRPGRCSAACSSSRS
ncbi:MAG: hypothetical protein ACRDOL_17415 [Streptosporangiaceae bacterium]